MSLFIQMTMHCLLLSFKGIVRYHKT